MTFIDDIEGMVFGDETESESEELNPGREQFSTGAQPTRVDDEWREFEFGFTARSVSVRTDSDTSTLIVSFDRPWQNRQSHIRLRPQDLPFSIGGESPVAEQRIYIRAASGTADVEVLAI